jgi:hypothetical protein
MFICYLVFVACMYRSFVLHIQDYCPVSSPPESKNMRVETVANTCLPIATTTIHDDWVMALCKCVVVVMFIFGFDE